MSGFDLNVPALVASGFTLTAALAWNEAAKGVVRSVYPAHQKNQTMGLIVYAIIVTILVVIIFAALRAFQKRTEAKKLRGFSSATNAKIPRASALWDTRHVTAT